MLDVLEGVVDELDVVPCGSEVVRLLGLLSRLEARAVAAVGAFDRSEEWRADGATSAASWLRHRARLSHKQAARLVGHATTLSLLAVTSGAWESGELSSGQVDAVVANVAQRHVGLFAEHEAEVVPALVPLDVKGVARAMARWKSMAEALDDEGPRDEPPSTLHLSPTLGGRFELSGSFEGLAGSIIDTAVRRATRFEDQPAEGPRSSAQRRADALVDICQFFLGSSPEPASGPRNRPHLNVVVDLDDLGCGCGGTTTEGLPLSGAALSALLCDSVLHRLVMKGGSTVLDYGTSTRVVGASLWAALVVRDGHCRFPGCDRPPGWSEAHHVVWVTQGGPTSLDNLCLLCSRHHHLVHSPGWGARLLPTAALEVTAPDARRYVSEPGRARVGAGLW
ncbi:MAG: DUF222 domain-containing protein [Acidimicrobiales bacterium]